MIKDKLQAVQKSLPPDVLLVFVTSRMAGSHAEWIDDAWDKALSKVARKRKVTDSEALYIPFIFVTDFQIKQAEAGKCLLLQHTLSKRDKNTPAVLRAFHTIFGSGLKWDGHSSRAIEINV